MDEWAKWFTDGSMDVFRLITETVDNDTTTDESQIYTGLKISVEGRDNDLQQTIIGDFALGEYTVYVRESDLDENGWPAVGDRVVMDGESYEIKSEADHSKSPSFFTLPRHKVFELTQDI